MNPQQDQTPGLRLPQPSFDVGQAPVAAAPMQYQPQQGMAAPQAAPATQQPLAGTPGGSPYTGLPPVAPVADMSAASVQPEDETALDQEWVTKAREIVLRTHSDPYMQSQELSKIKAQYIKVRYNKDIKTAEE
jgi:hypothetical protein